MEPTREELTECRSTFIDYAHRLGYDKAARRMFRYWNTGTRLAAWQAVQCEGHTKIEGSPHGQHLPDDAATAAARRWQPLFRNTGEAV